jgi:hypothetical protein
MSRMESSLGTQTWWSMALDRQRSLAITSPLQQLDSTKGHIGAQKHDIRTYCLYVIDQVALGMRAQRGERIDVVERVLGDLIAKCEPQVSAEKRGRIVTWVIEGLLNVRGRGPFQETLTEFDASGSPRKIHYSFVLLEAKDLGDEMFYLVASPEAIRLYTDLLARDVTDEQVANEYLFRFLVERGEWQKAAQESARMELLSLEYQQKIRRAVEITEMNVHAFSWRDSLVPILQRARQHVGDRIRTENSVLASLREKLSREDALSHLDRADLAKVEHTLDGVICRHTHLAQILMLANQRFAEAQDAQCYRARPLTTLANLESDLVRPILLHPLGQVSVRAEEFADFVFRPEPFPLPSLVEIIERLLRPEREHSNEETDTEENFQELQAEPLFLSAEEEAEAEEVLASVANQCTLSDLLDEMAAQGRSLKMRDLVVTTLLKSIGDPNAGICVTAGDTKVNSDLYKGAELIIAPSGRHSAESPRGKALTI